MHLDMFTVLIKHSPFFIHSMIKVFSNNFIETQNPKESVIGKNRKP